MITEEMKRSYARLAVRRGVNVQKGQRLVVRAQVKDAAFVRMIAEEAYEAGASAVDIRWSDEALTKLDYTWQDKDTLAEIRSNPQAGAIIDAMMAKGASERGDVADAVKDNPALQRMMGRMTLLSLLKQGGADEESIRQMNRILQGIHK